MPAPNKIQLGRESDFVRGIKMDHETRKKWEHLAAETLAILEARWGA
jgi:hypothetical protein